MREKVCCIQGCDSPVHVEFYGLERRKHTAVQYFCRSHGHPFLAKYRDGSGATMSAATLRDDLHFDLAWYCCEHTEDESVVSHVCLQEERGARRCVIEIGPHELQSLHAALQESSSLSYLSHANMGGIIQAMGGHLERVVIDQFEVGGNIYHAKLVIASGEQHVLVDIRPSDALVLAVLRNVPIFVGRKVQVSLTPA